MSALLERLGPYEIQSLLGSGGMGEVYRARDSRLARDVALKILPTAFASDTDRVLRFEQEARAASALNHPSIITIYDVGFAEKKAFIAMEFVDGKNLHEILRAGRLSLKRVLSIAVQLAEGIAKAHEAGIVHRDLKPENIMLTGDGFLKILDFGLAKLGDTPPRADLSDLATRTSAGFVVGTAGYMSPEQAAGLDVDFRSDQFSFGSILYEMLTGRRAFQERTNPETMAAVIRYEPESVSVLQPAVPAPLRWIVDRCMAKDPHERYASTRDLARDLQSLRDHYSEITSSSGEMRSSVALLKPGRGVMFSALALVAFVATGIFAFRYGRAPSRELTVLRTLTYSGSDSSPAISPDGRLLAFRSDRDGTPRIWLKQMQGGNEVALTQGPDDLPRFSPDGSSLLFIHKEGATGALFRVPVLGGEARKVISDAASADWSGNGKRIAFIRWKPGEGGPDSQFLTVNQDGSDLQEIAAIKNRQLNSVRWSPNSDYLVATVINQGNFGNRDAIALIDIKNKNTKWLLTAFSPTSAVWDGQKNQIAYFVPESGVALFQLRGASRLFVQDVDTGKREPVFWAPSAGEIMDIAGKGRLIMHSASLRENLREIQLNDSQSNMSSAWLTRGNSANRQPYYSADGKRILFSSNMESNLDLWELGTDSRSLKRITDDVAEDWDPSYSPDGNYIIWSSNRSGHFEIWLAGSDGSGARQVTSDGVDAENPQMTPDGKWIIYNSYNPDLKVRGVWKVHPDGSSGKRIVSGLTQWPEISPNGKYASYGFYKQTLNDRFTYERAVEIETGKTLSFEIEVSNRDRVGGRMRWMPDGKSIVFIDEDPAGNWGLFQQEFLPGQNALGSKHQLMNIDADRKMDTFAIAPDGSKIVVAEVEVLSSLILAEGIPRIESSRHP